MGEQLVCDALAEAVAAEGVDTHFQLMGHGQMFFSVALDALPGVRTISTRHEHCACAMATGYYFATGKVGFASVTCGPGFTQIMTALTSAAHAHVPLVVLAADAPLGQRWYNQQVDQSGLTRATGAHFIAAHNTDLMQDYVQEAFYVARFQRRPVVLSVPHDLLRKPFNSRGAYAPSSSVLPNISPMPPNPTDIGALVERMSAARSPIIVAGRGALRAGAQEAIEAMAERTGALLSTTLPCRGMFDHNPYSIGVAGGFASEVAVEQFRKADLVVAIGASLTHYTVDGGALFPQAEVVQIDLEPVGLRHGMKAADTFIRADAKLAAEAVVEALGNRVPSATIRTAELARRIVETPPDTTSYAIEPNTIDPRAVVRALDDIIPKEWQVVSGTGHSSYFYTHLRNRRPENHHILREFGAIGSSLSMAIGVAAARGDGRVILLDGDGGLIMHIQELESIKRQGIKLLICALNDGGFGAEVHKLDTVGVSAELATFGRPDFAAIAQGFGHQGATITEIGQFQEAFDKYQLSEGTAVWDVHIAPNVASPRGRKKAH